MDRPGRYATGKQEVVEKGKNHNLTLTVSWCYDERVCTFARHGVSGLTVRHLYEWFVYCA